MFHFSYLFYALWSARSIHLGATDIVSVQKVNQTREDNLMQIQSEEFLETRFHRSAKLSEEELIIARFAIYL